MIGYVTVGSNDLDRARGFYAELLATIGATQLMRMEDGFTLYGTSFEGGGLAVTKPYDGNPATVGNGSMTALVVDERAKVDALYAKAMSLGAADEGGPGLRGDEGPMAFYAGYFRDLDGNKLCVFRMGPA
jgi:catechol 2,3-dioxygenase-like lactoylglutathione lyase family enzyme